MNNPTRQDVKKLSIQELTESIAEFDEALDTWDENESGADHIAMFRNIFQQVLDEKLNKPKQKPKDMDKELTKFIEEIRRKKLN